MTIRIILGLVLYSLLLVAGQILFKMAARDAPLARSWLGLLNLLLSPWLWAAVVLYGFTTVLWVVLLQRAPLSRAYAFVAVGFVLVPAAGVLLFGEEFSPTFLIGTVLIVSGVLLVTISSP